MALTQQDKIECKDIAREIIKEVLIIHVDNCPHHQAYLVSRARVLGIVIGVILASGVSSGTIVAVVLKLLG